MSWVAVAVGVGGALLSASQQSDAASSAASSQMAGGQASLALQKQMYDTSQVNLAPYLGSGQAAQSKLNDYLGLAPEGGVTQAGAQTALDAQSRQDFIKNYGYDPGDTWTARTTPDMVQTEMDSINNAIPKDSTYGSLLTPFSASDLTANLAPNYAFMLDQGQSANKNAANLGGGLLGGNALQGLDTFTQNYAQNAYQQAYNNYNTNQSNIYSRLSGVAQQGQNSAVNAASNAINAGQSMGATAQGIGTAQAGGIIGSANALAGGINNASSYYQLGQIMNGGGGSTGGYSVAGNGALMGTGSGGFDNTGFSQYMVE